MDRANTETGRGNNVMCGSAWPHSEGFAHPLTTFGAVLDDITSEQKAKFYGGTAAELLGVS